MKVFRGGHCECLTWPCSCFQRPSSLPRHQGQSHGDVRGIKAFLFLLFICLAHTSTWGQAYKWKKYGVGFFSGLIKKSLWPKIYHLLGQPQSETHKLVLGLKHQALSLKCHQGRDILNQGGPFSPCYQLSCIQQHSNSSTGFHTSCLAFQSWSCHSRPGPIRASRWVCAGWTLNISRGDHCQGPHSSPHYPIGFSFSHSHPIKKKERKEKIHPLVWFL